ncbi:MAG: type-F conjugative transfer system secretin TraK, partial [Gammaproteobacteria bacterium]
MINCKKSLILLVLTWLSLNTAMAANTITVNDNNETLNLAIGNSGLTRIEIKQARIQRINHDSPDLEIQADEATGHIFIQPRSEQHFNLYLTTEDNLSYHLALTPENQASTPIIIDSKMAQRTGKKLKIEQDGYAKTLITLMQHLARAQIPPGFARVETIERLLSEDSSLQAHPLYSSENSNLRGE